MANSLASLALILHVCDGSAGCLSYPLLEPCVASNYLRGQSRNCSRPDDCCKDGVMYPQFRCSPPVTSDTPALMAYASFAEGDGGASACDGMFHGGQMVVSLSSGWFDRGRRCHRNITINANGRSVLAMVVDECDSENGCTADQDLYPPCPNNYIVASPAVWAALDVLDSQVPEHAVSHL